MAGVGSPAVFGFDALPETPQLASAYWGIISVPNIAHLSVGGEGLVDIILPSPLAGVNIANRLSGTISMIDSDEDRAVVM